MCSFNVCGDSGIGEAKLVLDKQALYFVFGKFGNLTKTGQETSVRGKKRDRSNRSILVVRWNRG